MKKPSSSYIRVRNSRIHNKGVFAKKEIPKNTKVIEYIGRKITKSESDKIYDKNLENHKKDSRNGIVYIFELNKKYDIDGDVSWNPAKYINHSCNPNCETEIIDDKIWIVSKRKIKKGEEITYNYGYHVDNYEEHPCKCGSENCVGYIVEEEQWPKLKRLVNKKRKKN